MRIQTKVIILVVVLAPLSVGALGFAVDRITSNQLEAGVRDHLESVVRVEQERIQSILDNHLQALKLVATDSTLAASVADWANHTAGDPARAADVARARAVLADAERALPGADGTEVTDAAGTVIASTNPATEGQSRIGYPPYEVGRYVDKVNELYRDGQGTPNLRASGPVMAGGRVVGVVLMGLSAGDLEATIADRTGLGETGETLLAEAEPDGTVGFLFTVRPDLPPALRIVASRDDLPATQALAGHSGPVANAVDYRGTPVLATTRFIPGPGAGWGLVAKMDTREALAPIAAVRATSLAIAVVVLVGGILVGVLASGTVTKPLRRLTTTAHTIAQKAGTPLPKMRYKDEVRDLESSFSAMVTGLMLNERQLTLRVEDRTRELESSVSLINATLEATQDGILVVDLDGRTTQLNAKFATIWGIPTEVLGTRDDKKMLDYVLGQLKEPQVFLTRVQELYAHPEVESFEVLEFGTGRVVSAPPAAASATRLSCRVFRKLSDQAASRP